MASLNRETREIIIGAIALVVFIAAFILITSRSTTPPSTMDEFYRITAIFDRIDGLFPGDDVRLGGIQVGFVDTASIDNNYRAILTLAVNKNIPLPLDTSAAIHTNGLFGSKFIVLEPGGDFDFLENGDEITYTQGSVIVQELLELIISEGKANLTQN